MTAKIVAILCGGLGNQLFIYAAAKRLAVVSRAELVLDDVTGFRADTKYQRTFQLDNFSIQCRRASAADRLEPFGRIRRYLKRAINRGRSVERSTYLVEEGAFDARLLHIRPTRTLHLQGYWQNERYFQDIESVIRSDLRIAPPTDHANKATADRIGVTNSVAVHVRFFDEPKVASDANAPKRYYCDAVAEMERVLKKPHYFVFCDKPEFVDRQLDMPWDRATLISHNLGDHSAYADLWLMSQCKNFIIANSTFSWWGAWLSLWSNKHVIAPDKSRLHRLSYWQSSYIVPNSWKTI